MATVPVKLVHDAALSTEDVDGLSPGQAHWWLRGDGDFVRLPRRVRGDQPLDLLVHLEPGHYLLGVGPAGKGVREDIDVAASAAVALAVPQDAPSLAGNTFVITGDLEAMSRDEAKTWLEARGGKVTGSVSAKTTFVVVGLEPGPKKLEKADALGIARLSEADLRERFGFPAAHVLTPSATKESPPERVKTILRALGLVTANPLTVAPIVGPEHFHAYGMVAGELWGIAKGPRGGSAHVDVDLDDRPEYAARCSCRERNPCKHAHALLFTADRYGAPAEPAPEGHRDAARFVPSFSRS